MIISCEKCTKKFNIQDNLIPNEGRLLQCGNCNHKWFYKLPTQNIKLEADNETISEEKKKIIEKVIESSKTDKNNEINSKDEKIFKKSVQKSKNNTNLIKISLVVIISIIALIILIDTFKFHLEGYIPSINSILNNLYETLKDLSLFAKDLIN